MVRLAALVLMLCSCGRFGFEPSARDGTDAAGGGGDPDGTVACMWGPWSAAAPVAGFEGSEWERSPEQRNDGLEMLFARYEVINNVLNAQIRRATRSTPSGPYGVDTTVVELDDPANDDLDPSLSADGLAVMLVSSRTGSNRAYEARRPNPDASFSAPALATGLDTHMISSVSLTPDGLGLYFNEGLDLWFVRRATRAQAFGTPVDLGFAGSDPSVSADGLELYFSRAFEVLARRRASVADAFTDEVQVLPASVGAGSPDISSDGTELLLIVSDQLQRLTRSCR